MGAQSADGGSGQDLEQQKSTNASAKTGRAKSTVTGLMVYYIHHYPSGIPMKLERMRVHSNNGTLRSDVCGRI